MYSALANLDTKRKIDIYIVDGGINSKNRDKLTQILNSDLMPVSIKWVKPDLTVLEGVKLFGSLNVTTYFRLLLPELLPTQVERVIYLDSDLVVEGNLANLWEQELGNCPAVAVQDYVFPYVCNGLKTYQQLGLASNTPYCNAGVMLINIKQWRIEALNRKILEYIRKFYDLVYLADQDGINALIANRFKLLDLKWNVQIFGVYNGKIDLLCKPKELIRDAFILHFTTPIKPWHPYYRQAGGSRFTHYLRKSKWFNDLEYLKWFANVRLPQIVLYSAAQIKRECLKKSIMSRRTKTKSIIAQDNSSKKYDTESSANMG